MTTKQQAIQHLEYMRQAIQRVRSIMTEGNEKFSGKNAETLKLLNFFDQDEYQYISEKKCPLPALSRILENPDKIVASTYSNMMYIALVLEPVIGIVAGIESEDNFPYKWSTDMLRWSE
jgi:hypothetical protein